MGAFGNEGGELVGVAAAAGAVGVAGEGELGDELGRHVAEEVGGR